MDKIKVLAVIALLFISPTVTSSTPNENVMHPNSIRAMNDMGDDSDIDF